MQLIDIQTIIEEIQTENPTEWQAYKNRISSFIQANGVVFKEVVTLAETTQLEGIKGVYIFQPKKNDYPEKKVTDSNFWKWSKRWANFPEFTVLEGKFLEKIMPIVCFCPYCWKMPIYQYRNRKNELKGTFHLDHIFPKAEYRHLTYNFYNLIPSCHVCNQTKGKGDIVNITGEIFHPYFGWIKPGKKHIRQELKDRKPLTFDEKIDDLTNHYSSDHFQYFHLDRIYQYAQDTDNDIAFIRHKLVKMGVDQQHCKSIGGKYDIEDGIERYFTNFYPETPEETLRYANGKLRRDKINKIRNGATII